jgi:pyruvate/2-oxoglutarate dehydrogenase complex dihydrolipoamide dehydrogenase (E3) component
LVVLGGSYIALEFAQIYRRFGSEVTVIQRSGQVLSREDTDISESVEEALTGEGIKILKNTSGYEFSKVAMSGEGVQNGTGVEIALTCGAEKVVVEASHLLVALGRKPVTDDIGLEKAGVETDPQGYIKVNDTLETNVEGIWALGDCNGPHGGKGGFTHTSYNDFEIVKGNLLDNDPRKLSDRIVAYNVYTDPPLARVGMNETQVIASGRKALIGKRAMTRVGRAKQKGETHGFLKVLVDAETERILGACLLGVEAGKEEFLPRLRRISR